MRKLAILALPLLLSMQACELDSFDPPTTALEGRIVYQDDVLGVRQRAIKLALYQDGYELRQDIPVEIHQDGTFAAMLFDGVYKLTQAGSGPWVADQDTITIDVRGATTVDMPVTPYFMIRNEAIKVEGSSVVATFDLEQVLSSGQLDNVNLYLGSGLFVDRIDNLVKTTVAAAKVGSWTGVRLEIPLTAALRERGYLYARVGVKTKGVANLLYTQVQRLELN